jgi:hypothetical protein
VWQCNEEYPEGIKMLELTTPWGCLMGLVNKSSRWHLRQEFIFTTTNVEPVRGFPHQTIDRFDAETGEYRCTIEVSVKRRLNNDSHFNRRPDLDDFHTSV